MHNPEMHIKASRYGATHQIGKKSRKYDIARENVHPLSMVVHACDPSHVGGRGGRRIVNSRTAQAKLGSPCLKNKI
jgi:hypothetical protein